MDAVNHIKLVSITVMGGLARAWTSWKPAAGVGGARSIGPTLPLPSQLRNSRPTLCFGILSRGFPVNLTFSSSGEILRRRRSV